jgi:menaquinone-dependent protoporphyrinogen oxidase
MRVLIAYGSKRGGTAGLSAMLGKEFDAAGCQTLVQPAREVRSLDGVDAVVIAGALYANHWHRDTRRFARRHVKALRERPVWLVSSGPLDDSATTRDIPPVQQVVAVMSRLGARGHVTFGGRLEPDAKGFPASAMAKTRAGAWRDPAHVHEWASAIAEDLGHLDSAM